MVLGDHSVKVDVENQERLQIMAQGNIRFSWVTVASQGGMTLQRAMNWDVRIEEWALDVPRVTVVNLGACDLANTEFNKLTTKQIKHEFPNRLMEFLRTWVDKAEAFIKTR